MSLRTPFFPDFHRRLFGTPPRTAAARALEAATTGPGQLQGLCARWIPARLLPHAASGLNSRQRLFGPVETFWLFLAQILARTSCRDALLHWLAERVRSAGPTAFVATPDTSAYCQARARLPQARLEQIHTHVAAQVQGPVLTDRRWPQHRVWLIDGGSLSMPDTVENQQVWPQTANQRPGCGFPHLHLVGLFCLGSGALVHTATGSWQTHESTLARNLWPILEKGDVLVGDRGYCSYLNLSQLQARGVQSVFRLHATRRADLRQGRRLGAQDRLIQWSKPRQRKAGWSQEEYDALPPTLTLRLVRYQISAPGARTREVVLVTTLLDPVAYPREELAALYHRRWEIELHWRECKTQLGLEILRCKTPALIRKELTLGCIAYNLVRALMQTAAVTHHLPLARLSFQGALSALRGFAAASVCASARQREQLFAACLSCLARDLLPVRPDRVEPRVLKRRPKAFDRMTRPRDQLRRRLRRPARTQRPRPA